MWEPLCVVLLPSQAVTSTQLGLILEITKTVFLFWEFFFGAKLNNINSIFGKFIPLKVYFIENVFVTLRIC